VTGIRLVPLQCPRCSRPLSAGEGEHLLATCDECGTTCEVVGGIPLPRERTIYRPRSASPTEYVPFWRFDTRVDIYLREATGMGQLFNDLFNLRQGDGKAEACFLVPAFEVNMEAFKNLSLKMLKLGKDRLQPWERAPALPTRCTVLSMDEASRTLEFILLTIEANKSDMMVSLGMRVDILASSLALLPASSAGEDMHLLV